MRIAYLDCFAGVSGDMFLGTLLGAGVPLSILEQAVNALNLDASFRVETVDRSGISSIKVHVLENGRTAEAPPAHTHPGEANGHSHAHAHEEHTHSEHAHSHSHADAHHTHSDGEHTQASASAEHSQGHTHTHAPQPAQPHVHGRSLSTIRSLIRASALPETVQQKAIQAFELLGHSEAKIHNVSVEHIHFHEVGAVDAIVDIIASCAGIAHLEASGPLEWHSSPINVGGGMVACAHGTFPVPAPATADLLTGMPTYSAHVQKELVTPTGAALLRMLAPRFGPQPPMRVTHIGYGAGTRNPEGFPNVLRLFVGEADTHQTASRLELIAVLETALDDATPQLLAYVAEQALAAGALDVMLTPAIMKKGRPGTLVTILCNEEDTSTFEALLLRETTTLGVRRRTEQRACLDRAHVTVQSAYGPIRVKLGSRNGETLNATPEFEDCRAAATRHSVPLKQVSQTAVAAYEGSHKRSPEPKSIQAEQPLENHRLHLKH